MTTFWTIQESLARLDTPNLAGEIDVLFPWRGFSLAASKRPGSAILKVHTRRTQLDQPETLVDCYQRGVDLVATYVQTADRTVRPQIYWRYIPGEQSAGLELVLSTQTSLLASEPKLTVESTLPPGEWFPLSESGQRLNGPGEPYGALFRPRDLAFSYCEFIFPADRAAGYFTGGDTAPSVGWELFPDSLEKGVVRRGRIRGVFIPRADDETHAATAWQQFLDSPLVLST